jgi:nucleoside-diphosphate-sugar epimerase
LWRDGHEVTVLDALLFGGESLLGLGGAPRFTLIPGDLREEATLTSAVAGHDAVVLLGAIVGEPACNRDPEAAMSTNLAGARLALATARRAGVERFVFVSTCSNYGIADGDAPATESSPLRPISVYAESKVGAERAALEAAGDGFHPTVLRLATAFGISPRMRFDLLVSDFTLAAVRERKIVIYGEQFWRPFVHVADIAEAIASTLAAEADVVSGEVFNVGSSGNNLRKIELGERVARLVPGTELEFVERHEDPRSYRVDFAKIEDGLGFRAAWTVDDGITELAAALAAGVFPDPDSPRHRN